MPHTWGSQLAANALARNTHQALVAVWIAHRLAYKARQPAG